MQGRALTLRILALTSLCLSTQGLAMTFDLPQGNDSIVGKTEIILSKPGDTWPKLVREYNLGYRDIELANPKRSRYWEIKPNTKITIPNQFILPETQYNGIVVNIPEMRLYYFMPEKNKVFIEPVAVGKPGWMTPFFEATIIKKVKDPVWRVPKSIHDYKLTKGIELPEVMEANEENPLGKFALRLSYWSVLIHGTIEPKQIGTRVYSGCIRLYPEAIEQLFDLVEPGVEVKTIDQPFKVGWLNGQLYLEVHPPLAELHYTAEVSRATIDELIMHAMGNRYALIDWNMVDKVLAEKSGVPTNIML